MTTIPFSDQLTQRITLWKRTLGETTEGDPSETWTPVAKVWARLRLKEDTDPAHPRREGQRVEIMIRSTRYSFHGIEWRGQFFHLQGKGIEDPETATWRGVGRLGRKQFSM
jgi:hypothetical protein